MAPKESVPAAELIGFLARSIVSDPDAVEVQTSEDGTLIELETAPDDRGRVIGRQGRVAKAMRAVMGAAAGGRDLRLDIVD